MLRRRAVHLAVGAAMGVAFAWAWGFAPALADPGPPPEAPGAWVPYDGESPSLSRGGRLAGSFDSSQFLIRFLTDCTGSPLDPPSCGGPPARWTGTANPLHICSTQGGRPPTLSAQAFREAIQAAARTWNEQEAATGVVYLGDCEASLSWAFGNGRNEVGWDDGRNVLTREMAGLTRSRWDLFASNAKELRETDVVLDEGLASVAPTCLESTIVHELGHALGLGHSDDRNDLMYPSFNPELLATCKLRPSQAETVRLQALYGIDRNPVVGVSGGGVVEPLASATVTARGSDPEGGPLAFTWEQVAGPAVTMVSEGATASFVAPAEVGATITLRVTAFDRYLHTATAEVGFVVNQAAAAPSAAPSLESFLAGAGVPDALLAWSAVPDAATYEFCSRPVGFPSDFECFPVSGPEVGVNWDTLLGSTGRAGDHRLITAGARETFLRACNARGCSAPGIGGLSGGLRWPNSGIDYDYFALAYDVGATRFTIVGVVNVSGEPRSFTLGTGPEEEPGATRLAACGRLPAGQACFGYIGPGGGHGEYVDILSEAPDRPTTEHRIRVR